LLAVLCVCLAACSGEPEIPARGPASPTPAPGSGVTVSGKVVFHGQPPAPMTVRMTGDCAGEATGNDVKVRDGRVENAFVWVREGLEDVVFERPQSAVTVDQQKCTFVPRVLGVQSGQPIEFLNSDPTLHNVHTMPQKSRATNFGLGVRGAKRAIRIPNAEVMITVKCDVHPWMRAYVGVLDHPHFAVTGPDGTFRFANLPPGEYVIEAWHERFGTKTAKVKLGAGETSDLDLAYPE
jgi:plastocyanin